MLADLIRLFYPDFCQACGQDLLQKEKYICVTCRLGLPRTQFHIQPGNPLEKTFWGRMDIVSATAYLFFRKGGKVQEILHNLKYRGARELGEELGRMYAADLLKSNSLQQVDVIVPVPLNPKKEKQRGYNQSYHFAKGLGEMLEKPVSVKNLVRSRHTESQTRKSREKRWENVSQGFCLGRPRELEGKHVLLVDDVVTTGATMEACGMTLREEAGCLVSLASIAYAV